MACVETGLRVATTPGLYISKTMFSPELNLVTVILTVNIVGDCSEKHVILIVMVERTLNVSMKVAFVIFHRHLHISDFSL